MQQCSPTENDIHFKKAPRLEADHQIVPRVCGITVCTSFENNTCQIVPVCSPFLCEYLSAISFRSGFCTQILFLLPPVGPETSGSKPLKLHTLRPKQAGGGGTNLSLLCNYKRQLQKLNMQKKLLFPLNRATVATFTSSFSVLCFGFFL